MFGEYRRCPLIGHYKYLPITDAFSPVPVQSSSKVTFIKAIRQRNTLLPESALPENYKSGQVQSSSEQATRTVVGHIVAFYQEIVDKPGSILHFDIQVSNKSVHTQLTVKGYKPVVECISNILAIIYFFYLWIASSVMIG